MPQPHGLSRSETAKLVNILLQSTNVTFQTATDTFHSVFGTNDRFRACCCLVLLLEDSQVLQLPQRLTAWYIIHAGVDGLQATHPVNPFLSTLVKAAGGSSSQALVERNLVLQLLLNEGLGQLAKQTPMGYATGQNTHLIASAPSQASLEQTYLTGPSQPSGHSHIRVGIPRLLGDPSAPDPGVQAAQAAAACALDSHSAAQAAQAAQQEFAVHEAVAVVEVSGACARGFEPAWARPAPPVMTPFVDELAWAAPELHNHLVWDSSVGEDGSRGDAVREILSKALRGPLLPAQQQVVLDELDADPRLVHRLGLAPRHLPLLVEHTPVVAYELLIRLMHSPRVHAFLAVLAHTEMSLHSMEVVNRLTTAVDLPQEFVHLYVTNCINSCEATQDKYMQNRLVRLVCVFLQSLIRNRIINIQDLLHEVQSFCINFSRIREAAKLFRLLKQIESGGKMSAADLVPGSPTAHGSGGASGAGAASGAGGQEEGKSTGQQG